MTIASKLKAMSEAEGLLSEVMVLLDNVSNESNIMDTGAASLELALQHSDQAVDALSQAIKEISRNQ